MRIITHVIEVEIEVDENDQNFIIYLLSIYDKSEISNISENILKNIIEDIHIDLNNEETE